jgi:hypothetical protein
MIAHLIIAPCETGTVCIWIVVLLVGRTKEGPSVHASMVQRTFFSQLVHGKHTTPDIYTHNNATETSDEMEN